jgi:hypothetical protein
VKANNNMMSFKLQTSQVSSQSIRMKSIEKIVLAFVDSSTIDTACALLNDYKTIQ